MLAKPKEIETTKTKKVFSKQKSNVPMPIKSIGTATLKAQESEQLEVFNGEETEEAGVSEIANPEEVLTELKASTV